MQINVALLVPLGALMLGMGERSMTLPAVVGIVALASIFVTDQWGWFRLNRMVANAVAILATVASVVLFISATSEEQLTTIANLLVYLQIVLLLQKKNVRLYWQLLVLSGLEVVVATALDSSLLFGALLVVYLFVALAALGLIFVLCEAESHAERGGAPHSVAVPPCGAGPHCAGAVAARAGNSRRGRAAGRSVAATSRSGNLLADHRHRGRR